MLTACKVTESPKQAFGYFMHAKDEYNHARSFFEMLSNRGKRASIEIARDFRFKPPSLITKGYISKQGFLIEKMKLKDFYLTFSFFRLTILLFEFKFKK